MAIEFYCGTCNKLLRTSDDRAGVQAKCPQCGESITVPSVEQSLMREDELIEDYEEDDEFEEYGQVEDVGYEPALRPRSTQVCTYCGETISAQARVCRYCGEEQLESFEDDEYIPEAVEVGDVFSTSWALFRDEMGLCVGASFLAGILVSVVYFPLAILGQIVNLGLAPAGGPVALIGAVFIPMLTYFVTIVTAWFLQIGLGTVYLKVALGRRPEIGDLFSGGRYLLRMMACSFVFAIITTVGMMACIIPGIILHLVFWPYVYLLTDRDLPGLESLLEAKEITQGTWMAVFGIVLLSVVINVAGMLALCVGLLFTTPWTQLMLTVAYCRMTGQRTAAD